MRRRTLTGFFPNFNLFNIFTNTESNARKDLFITFADVSKPIEVVIHW